MLESIASALAQALIAAAATDAWQTMRPRIRQMFESDEPDLASRLTDELAARRAEILAASADQAAQTRQVEQAALTAFLMREIQRAPHIKDRLSQLAGTTQQQQSQATFQSKHAGRDITEMHGNNIRLRTETTIRTTYQRPYVVPLVLLLLVVVAVAVMVTKTLKGDEDPASVLWGRWECSTCTGPAQASAYEFNRNNTVYVDNNAVGRGSAKYSVLNDHQIRFTVTDSGILSMVFGSPLYSYSVQGNHLTLRQGGESATYTRVQ